MLQFQDSKAKNLQIYQQGYILYNDKIYEHNEIQILINNLHEKGIIDEAVKDFSGNFLLILKETTNCKIITDPYGSLPLFYTEVDSTIIISQNWISLQNSLKNKRIDEHALVDILCFSYVQGARTLIKGIKEFPPHTITQIKNDQDNLEFKSYRQFKFEHQSIPFKKAQKRFIEILNNRFGIYYDYMLKSNQKVFMPLTGGFDSRLLSYFALKRNLPIRSMTYYYEGHNCEVDVAAKLVKALPNFNSWTAFKITEDKFLEMLTSPQNYYSLTTSHVFQRMQRECLKQLPADMKFNLAGHTGDLITGGHLTTKMRFFKKRDDVVNYIVNFKCNHALADVLFELNSHYKEILFENIKSNISESENWHSSYYIWNLEQRQRRFIIRSSIICDDPLTLILPYYDNELVDFFRQLPYSYLLRQKLFVNTIFTKIFPEFPILKNTPRESGDIKLIGNPYIADLWPKVIKKLQRVKVRKGLEHKIYDTIPKIEINMPSEFPTNQYFNLLQKKGIPLPYMQSLIAISEVIKAFNE